MDRLVLRAGVCIEARKDQQRLYRAWHTLETWVRTIFLPTQHSALETLHPVHPQHQLYRERLGLLRPRGNNAPGCEALSMAPIMKSILPPSHQVLQACGLLFRSASQAGYAESGSRNACHSCAWIIPRQRPRCLFFVHWLTSIVDAMPLSTEPG